MTFFDADIASGRTENQSRTSPVKLALNLRLTNGSLDAQRQVGPHLPAARLRIDVKAQISSQCNRHVSPGGAQIAIPFGLF